MSVIGISRGSYSYGKAIAEKVAQRLGYASVSREVLIEASEEFNVPEVKLVSAVDEAPSILDRFVDGKDKYMTYIEAALLRHLRKDNVVYHGFGGLYFIRHIPHVLKVRINADMEERLKLLMESDRLPKKKALSQIKNLDRQRKKWSKHLYGVDPWNSSLYDLAVQVGKISVDDVIQIICNTVALPRFKTTPESQQVMEDLCLAAEVKAALIGVKRSISVSAQNGVVYLRATILEYKKYDTEQNIRNIVAKIPNVRDVKIDFVSVPAYLQTGLDI